MRLTLTRTGRALARAGKTRKRVDVSVQTRGKDGVVRRAKERLTLLRPRATRLR
jgi:hypothetical protein